AIFTDACDVPVTSDTRAAIERAGRELQKMGIVVEAVKPPVDEGDRLWWAYNGADGNQLVTEALGEHLKLSRDRLRNFMVASEGKSAAEFFKIAIQRDTWRVQLAEFMERYPIILAPTFCVTAFKHGAAQVEIDGKTSRTFSPAGRSDGSTARDYPVRSCHAEKIARVCRSDSRLSGAHSVKRPCSPSQRRRR